MEAASPKPSNSESQEVQANYRTTKRYNLNYMHDPPRLLPNYDKKRRRILPKTNISKVLLYDNATQDKMLDSNLSQINVEKYRAVRMFHLNRHSFLKRRETRMKKLQDMSARVTRKIQTCQSQNVEKDQRTGSRYSYGSRRSSCESSLSYLNFLNLPHIDPGGERRHVVYKYKGTDGKVNIYYSIDNGIFSDVIPSYSFYPKTTDDPRFQELEESLERMTINYDSYNELSPSYRRDETVLPEHIDEIKKLNFKKNQS